MKVNMRNYSHGETIRIIREWTELTQKEFAKKINKSKRTIEQYEANKIDYNISTLLRIAEEFNIDIILEKK